MVHVQTWLRRAFLVSCLVLLGALPARAQLSVQGNEATVPYSGYSAFVLTNLPVNPNLLSGTGTNTFLIGVSPPANSARIYITNDTANACNNLTVSVASTGNVSLNSFNNSIQAWQSVLAQVGQTAGYSASNLISLPANSTVGITTAPIMGTKIALFIVLSSGCATTNIDAQVVFGNFSITSPNIQGVIPTGQNGASENPVVCGGLNTASLVEPCGIYQSGVTAGQGPVNGMGIGAPNQSSTAGFIFVTMPNGNGGPLAIDNYAAEGYQGTLHGLTKMLGGSYTAGTDCNTSGTACAGLYTSDTGIASSISMPSPIVGLATATWQSTGNGTLVALQGCRFTIVGTNASTGSGSATVDFYIQDSDDNSNWTDRVHFPTLTFTTTPSGFKQWAAFTGNVLPQTCTAGTCTIGGINTIASATLAANSIIEGPPGKFLRFAENSSAVWSCTTCNVTMYCK